MMDEQSVHIICIGAATAALQLVLLGALVMMNCQLGQTIGRLDVLIDHVVLK